MVKYVVLTEKTRKNLSLLSHCKTCGSKCCKVCSPIISEKERERIIKKTGQDYFLECYTQSGTYYIIGMNRNGTIRDVYNEPCPFLAKDGTCSIQLFKPMDCTCYPVRAIPKEQNRVYWTVDNTCPAVGSLTEQFLHDTRRVGLISIKRFLRIAYHDWLEKFAKWSLNPHAKISSFHKDWKQKIGSCHNK